MNLDLDRFERLYEQFDAGHGQEHIQRVRNLALELAEKYLPDKQKLVYIAATLHDIGLIHGRENHEANGAKMALADEKLQQDLSETELRQVAEAIREHRASSGQPKSVLAKIISDADKVSDSTEQALRRAYEYGRVNFPELSHDEQLWRSAEHLLEKFGSGGTGRRTYFPESMERLLSTYTPIFRAVRAKDMKYLEDLFQQTEGSKVTSSK